MLILVHHLILIIANNKYFALLERDTFGINESFGAPEKKFSVNFSRPKTQFCLGLHYKGDSSYLFLDGKGIYKFKANHGNANFSTRFCLGIISDGLLSLEKYLCEEMYTILESITILMISLTY